jgi:hypothetical protein
VEISDIRRRVRETAERARRLAAERRTRNDEAVLEYEAFLSEIGVPLFRQLVGILRADGFMFSLFTPGGSVRIMSDRSRDDYIELALDATGPQPQVVGYSSHRRGSRAISSETAIGHGGSIRDLTEEDVLAYVLKELEPLVER